MRLSTETGMFNTENKGLQKLLPLLRDPKLVVNIVELK